MNHFARNTSTGSTGLAWEEICQADKEGIDLSKHNLYRYLSQKQIDWKKLISKKLLPDEAYLVNNELKVYEKKFQQTPGSVDEKLQTCAFKILQYRKIGRALGVQKVAYTYLLNNWFSKPEYKDVLNYIHSVDGCDYKIMEE